LVAKVVPPWLYVELGELFFLGVAGPDLAEEALGEHVLELG
jgi:hypothetical protein